MTNKRRCHSERAGAGKSGARGEILYALHVRFAWRTRFLLTASTQSLPGSFEMTKDLIKLLLNKIWVHGRFGMSVRKKSCLSHKDHGTQVLYLEQASKRLGRHHHWWRAHCAGLIPVRVSGVRLTRLRASISRQPESRFCLGWADAQLQLHSYCTDKFDAAAFWQL